MNDEQEQKDIAEASTDALNRWAVEQEDLDFVRACHPGTLRVITNADTNCGSLFRCVRCGRDIQVAGHVCEAPKTEVRKGGEPPEAPDYHTRLNDINDLDECKRLLQECRERCYGLAQEIATTGYGKEVVLRRELQHHRAETERLRELLAKYGRHNTLCALNMCGGPVCTCGWREVRAEFRRQE